MFNADPIEETSSSHDPTVVVELVSALDPDVTFEVVEEVVGASAGNNIEVGEVVEEVVEDMVEEGVDTSAGKEPEEQPGFKCINCNKTFKHKRTLKTHERLQRNKPSIALFVKKPLPAHVS